MLLSVFTSTVSAQNITSITSFDNRVESSIEQLKKEIKQYIYYYNNERIKSNLNKMSPIEYRTHFYNN